LDQPAGAKAAHSFVVTAFAGTEHFGHPEEPMKVHFYLVLPVFAVTHVFAIGEKFLNHPIAKLTARNVRGSPGDFHPHHPGHHLHGTHT
jgi:hypothetical protein